MRSGTRALAVLVAACALGGAATPAGAATCTAARSWGTLSPRFEARVVALVNARRRALHLHALLVNRALRRSARWKSLHMARYAYFSHEDPLGNGRVRSPFQRMRDCGYRARHAMGENIAAGYATPAAVMRAWLHSPGHRANIENPAYREIGVGAAYRRASPYGWYWTQDFGG